MDPGKLSLLLMIVSVLFMSDLVWRLFENVTFSTRSDKTKLLIIGIMSAQDNFKERESIRNTWGQLIQENVVDIKFLIGSEVCPVPLIDRITPYVCENWSQNILPGINSTISNKVPDSSTKLEGYTGFSFIVKHNVSLYRLGVHSEIFKSSETKLVRVFLYDAASGHKVASATFVRDFYPDNDFVWKTVRTLHLPANFEGELKLVTDHYLNVSCTQNIQNKGVIQLFELEKQEYYKKFKEPACVLVAFRYSIEDEKKLVEFIKAAKSRKKKWDTEIEILKYQLEIESRAYSDILLFNIIDVYKHLPLKLFEFLKWNTKVGGYKYLLKTDDDVFLDINRIVSVLTANSKNKNWDWWSCFRLKCPPPNYGKWRDKLYPNKIYPAFPSGAGYIIPKNIASILISKNNIEDITAGEDVTIGVWLFKTLKKKPRELNTTNGYWSCGTQCSPILPCNVPQLPWKDLHHVFFRYISFKAICPV